MLDNKKKNRLVAILLAGLLLFISAGIYTGFFSNVLKACKAFIYCKGPELSERNK